jgi:hypothetical protein
METPEQLRRIADEAEAAARQMRLREHRARLLKIARQCREEAAEIDASSQGGPRDRRH